MTEAAKDKILKVADVAALYGVDPKTVARWANRGWLPYFRTPGGHHRFYERDVQPQDGGPQR